MFRSTSRSLTRATLPVVLLVGEVLPQAACKRFGLAIGFHARRLVWAMLIIALPVAYPLAKFLDWLLGEEDALLFGGLFRRAQLRALVDSALCCALFHSNMRPLCFPADACPRSPRAPRRPRRGAVHR